MNQQHSFHLNYRKLLAFGNLAQQLLQNLLNSLSWELSKSNITVIENKYAEALSFVLKKNEKKVKQLSNLFIGKGIELIYEDFHKGSIKEKVYSYSLDTCALADILLGIKDFDICSLNNHKDFKCNSGCHTGKNYCCTKCTDSKHLCSKCNRVRCTGKCCQSNSICVHPCQHQCGIQSNDCSNNQYVCCKECEMCLNCLLAILKVENLDELIEKLINGETFVVEGNESELNCKNFLLRLSVTLLKKLRNITSHLKAECCNQMDNETFSNATLPSFCKSWNEIQDIYLFSIQNVLNHLEAKRYIKSTEKSLYGDYLRRVIAAHNHSLLDPHSAEIGNYYAVEQFYWKAIVEKLELIPKKSLKIIITFVFKNPVKFDLVKSPEAREIYGCVKQASNIYFGANNIKVNFPGIKHNPNPNELSLRFKITSSELDFKKFENLQENKNALDLWELIEEELKNDLPPGTEIRISNWDIDSINIEVSIFKASGEGWEKDEVEKVNEMMPIVSKRIQNSFAGDLSNCNMNYIARRKKKAKPPYFESWVFQIHAFSEDMSKKLDTFDTKAFAENLEPLIAKETVRISEIEIANDQDIELSEDIECLPRTLDISSPSILPQTPSSSPPVKLLPKETNDEQWNRIRLQRYQFQSYHNYIPPVADFIGRNTELKELHNKIINSTSKLAVLYGLPGVGKSETARTYCVRYGEYFQDVVLWINAGNEPIMEAEFQDIAKKYDIPNIKSSNGKYVEKNKLIKLVYQYFSTKLTTSSRNVLFVFDGADNQKALENFLPKTTDYAPYILVTSQCETWDRRLDHLRLDVFEKIDALQFVVDNVGKDECANMEEINKLLDDVGCHPLALQQIVSYVTKTNTTISEYRTFLNDRKNEKGLDQIGNPSVNKTMSISIDKLRVINPNAVELLNILAQLDGNDIKKEFLMLLVDGDNYKLNEILALLQKYSVINFNNSQVIQIHSLTQLFLKGNQSSNECLECLERICQSFVKDLDACTKASKPRDGKIWLNHFFQIYGNKSKNNYAVQSSFQEQKILEEIFSTRGNYSNILEVLQKILELIDKCNPRFSSIKHIIALCFQAFEEYEKALQLYQEVEKIQLRTLGSNNPEYLSTKNNMASCYYTMKDNVTALQLYQEVEKVRFIMLGSKHPEYLATKHSIASCFQAKGDHKKALVLYQEVEEIQLKMYGSNDSRYLTTKNNIALCFQAMGDYEKELQLYQELEETLLTKLGANHRLYLTTRSNEASCLYAKGDHRKALQLYHQVEKTLLKTLGLDHRYYITTKKNIDRCFARLKEKKTEEQNVNVNKCSFSFNFPMIHY